ncbi:hypothetical protein ADUPG1_006585 [Aduncisulcus paluster]|uniref:Uncharacterized protein n=1 Tax=Aduncisulcus paluster TaxID=2918883 RepID=A0ABQ5KIR8_9EUKA|nr:hypothetical protein ADUPG1_006585 [Aduncisulcus paluster]
MSIPGQDTIPSTSMECESEIELLKAENKRLVAELQNARESVEKVHHEAQKRIAEARQMATDAESLCKEVLEAEKQRTSSPSLGSPSFQKHTSRVSPRPSSTLSPLVSRFLGTETDRLQAEVARLNALLEKQSKSRKLLEDANKSLTHRLKQYSKDSTASLRNSVSVLERELRLKEKEIESQKTQIVRLQRGVITRKERIEDDKDSGRIEKMKKMSAEILELKQQHRHLQKRQTIMFDIVGSAISNVDAVVLKAMREFEEEIDEEAIRSEMLKFIDSRDLSKAVEAVQKRFLILSTKLKDEKLKNKKLIQELEEKKKDLAHKDRELAEKLQRPAVESRRVAVELASLRNQNEKLIVSLAAHEEELRQVQQRKDILESKLKMVEREKTALMARHYSKEEETEKIGLERKLRRKLNELKAELDEIKRKDREMTDTASKDDDDIIGDETQ